MPTHLQALIDRLGLVPHPEGGYYRETYRSALEFDAGPPFNAARASCTGIYFLLTGGNFSALHRIRSDEMWHFYDGDPLHVHMIAPDGTYSVVTIGRDIEAGELPQFVVPAGHWFGATVSRAEGFALVGCTVSPGFDFADFELARREDLVARYPAHEAIIRRLTRG